MGVWGRVHPQAGAESMCTGRCGIGVRVHVCSCGAVLREDPRQQRVCASGRGPSGLGARPPEPHTAGFERGPRPLTGVPVNACWPAALGRQEAFLPTRVPVSTGPNEAPLIRRGDQG